LLSIFFFKFNFWKVKLLLKILNFFLLVNKIMNVVFGIMEKTQRFALRNIVAIQFYNRYFYSRTKIERVLLRLLKRVLSMSCVRQHMWVRRSLMVFFFRWVIIIIVTQLFPYVTLGTQKTNYLQITTKPWIFHGKSIHGIKNAVKRTKSKYYYKTLYGTTRIVGSISILRQNAHCPIL